MTLMDMMKNGMSAWSSISDFVVVLMGVVGIWIAFIAIVGYKNAGEGKGGIAKPIFQTILAALMVAAARFFPILSETIEGKSTEFKPADLLSNIPQNTLGLDVAFSSVLLFVQMLGVIALFRGFLLLYTASGKGEGLGKAFTHIIGGVLAVNIQLTIAMLATTFYPGVDLASIGL